VNYGFKDIVVRTAVAPAQIASPVSRQLRLLDADVPLGEVETMTDFMNGQTSDARFTAALLGLFAGLGTILAVVGAYGVISYLVAQRTRELGVRKALGADSRDILWLVLRQGIAMGAAGVAFGLAGVAAVERFVSGLLYGVSGSDPWTLAGASLLLLLVAAAASAIPARRAMRIDPVQALRGE
jgi:ABC-type antimicrobial peptide transport system permease subunit